MTARRLLLVPLLLVLCAQTRPHAQSPIEGQGATQPASAPSATQAATATAPATTQSAQGIVRQSVLSVLVAMHDGDRATLLANCYSATPSQRKAIESIMDLGIEAYRVNRIAIARWGQSGDGVVERFGSERNFKRMTEAFSKATVTIDGNSARIEPVISDTDDDDMNVIFMKLVGGRWMMDFNKMLEEPDDAGLTITADPPFVEMARETRTTILQLGRDIEAGKYKNPQDARDYFDHVTDERARAMNLNAGTQPAETQPK